MNKPRVIKDFDKLDVNIQEQIKLTYPLGFSKRLISFKNVKGEFVSALLFETEEKYYLVRMTKQIAKDIVRLDDDYDDDGILKDEVRMDYSEKYKPDDLDELIDEDEDVEEGIDDEEKDFDEDVEDDD